MIACNQLRRENMSIYDIKAVRNNGEEITLEEYKGKVLLIINSATGCGFTPQYDDLEDMYEELHDKGLEILDFPCNQFANQAPGSDEEIASFCSGRYGITFPLFQKIEVNGENAHPLFQYLKEKQGTKSKSLTIKTLSKLSKTSKSDDIHWNFTKFLVNKEGEVIARFEPVEKMKNVKKAVEELL